MMNISKRFLHPNLTKAKTNQKTQVKKVVKSKQKTQKTTFHSTQTKKFFITKYQKNQTNISQISKKTHEENKTNFDLNFSLKNHKQFSSL